MESSESNGASGQRRFAELFLLKLIKMSFIIVEAIHGRCVSFMSLPATGFGDIWWTDNPIYFSSTGIDTYYDYIVKRCSGIYCNWCVSLDIG